MTEKELSERHQKAGRVSRKHGMSSFDMRGISALDLKERSRYAELRVQLASSPGRADYKLELLVHLAMLLDLGFSHLRELAEQGKPIWSSSPIKRLGTYVNSTMRLLDSFPRDTVKGFSAELQRIEELIEVEDDATV